MQKVIGPLRYQMCTSRMCFADNMDHFDNRGQWNRQALKHNATWSFGHKVLAHSDKQKAHMLQIQLDNHTQLWVHGKYVWLQVPLNEQLEEQHRQLDEVQLDVPGELKEAQKQGQGASYQNHVRMTTVEAK